MNRNMRETEFQLLVRALSASSGVDPKSKSAKGARLVLVNGFSRNAAAKKARVDVAAVSRMVARIQDTSLCPCCGQPRPSSES
jgi:hypothetical protein